MENHDQRQNLGKEMAKMDGKNENVGMKRKLMENKPNFSGKKVEEKSETNFWTNLGINF
jgi:hypothetical protein